MKSFLIKMEDGLHKKAKVKAAQENKTLHSIFISNLTAWLKTDSLQTKRKKDEKQTVSEEQREEATLSANEALE